MTTKEHILYLRDKGYSYKQIQEAVSVAKSTISFHCNPKTKARVNARHRKYIVKRSKTRTKVIGDIISGLLNKQS